MLYDANIAIRCFGQLSYANFRNLNNKLKTNTSIFLPRYSHNYPYFSFNHINMPILL